MTEECDHVLYGVLAYDSRQLTLIHAIWRGSNDVPLFLGDASALVL